MTTGARPSPFGGSTSWTGRRSTSTWPRRGRRCSRGGRIWGGRGGGGCGRGRGGAVAGPPGGRPPGAGLPGYGAAGRRRGDTAAAAGPPAGRAGAAPRGQPAPPDRRLAPERRRVSAARARGDDAAVRSPAGPGGDLAAAGSVHGAAPALPRVRDPAGGDDGRGHPCVRSLVRAGGGRGHLPCPRGDQPAALPRPG